MSPAWVGGSQRARADRLLGDGEGRIPEDHGDARLYICEGVSDATRLKDQCAEVGDRIGRLNGRRR
jgi:hypothetical protein